jgi:hypothetical protein
MTVPLDYSWDVRSLRACHFALCLARGRHLQCEIVQTTGSFAFAAFL